MWFLAWLACPKSVEVVPLRGRPRAREAAPRRRRREDGDLPERAAVVRPAERRARAARGAVARGQRGLRARGRRPARARALRRAHGVQRDRAVPEAARSSTTSRRSACGSAPTSTRTRPSTRPSTSSRSRPTTARDRCDKALDILRDWAGDVVVRPGRGRQGARRRARGVAARPRRRRADHDKQLPILFRARTYGERLPIGLPRDPQDRAARHALPLLQGLVPPATSWR